MSWRLGRNDRDERGSTTLELVVWAPGLLLMIGLLIVAGRVNSANAAVEQAAVDAARTASSARSAAGARHMAQASAEKTLAAQGCSARRRRSSWTRPAFAPGPARARP